MQSKLVLTNSKVLINYLLRKYKFLIKKRESAVFKHLNDSRTFTECSNGMNDIYKTLKNKVQVKNVKY